MPYLAVFKSIFRRPSFSVTVIIVVGLALVSRLILANTAQHPGHGDLAFYYSTAENLVAGRGFTIDYIWNYLSIPEAITHYSNDYWMPLTSVIISLPMFVFGRSLFAALLPSILAGMMMSVVTFALSTQVSRSKFVHYSASALVLILPALFRASLLTDSAIYYALFASSSLLFIAKGLTDPRFFFLSSIFIGLAHLTRQDGVLLIPLLVGAILFKQTRRTAKVKFLALTLTLYVVILSPLLIQNFKIFGRPFPPGPSKAIFVTHFEDLYSYSKELTLENYLKWGVLNIVGSKVRMALVNARVVYSFLGEVLSIFAMIGIAGLAFSQDRKSRLEIYLPSLLFLALLSAFYAVIATFPGEYAFRRSALAAVPVLVLIAVDAIHRHIPSRTAGISVILLAAGIFFYQSINAARLKINSYSQMGKKLSVLGEIVTRDAHHRGYEDIVIMTRIPWEVHYSTRYKTIQIPNERLEIICEVAQRYGANYLLLPAPREALQSLYAGEVFDARFEFVDNVPESDLKLFRIKVGPKQLL